MKQNSELFQNLYPEVFGEMMIVAGRFYHPKVIVGVFYLFGETLIYL
jgi:hypothetical protein